MRNYDVETLPFVRGDAVGLYARRANLSDRALAAAVYGADRAESQRRRIKLLRERRITTLGTRGLSPDSELWALASALHLGPGEAHFLRSETVFTLIKGHERRGLLIVGEAVIGWPDEDSARLAAAIAADAGFDRPFVHETTAAELLDLERSMGLEVGGWIARIEPLWALTDFEYLIDVQRYLDGEDELLDSLAFLNPGGLLFEHLGTVFHFRSGHPRHLGWLQRVRRLIDRAMEIESTPRLAAEMRERASELYAMLTPSWDASVERAVELHRRAGLPWHESDRRETRAGGITREGRALLDEMGAARESDAG